MSATGDVAADTRAGTRGGQGVAQLRLRVTFAPGPLAHSSDGHPKTEGSLARSARRLDRPWEKPLTKKEVAFIEHEILQDPCGQYAHSINKLKQRCGLLPKVKTPRPFASSHASGSTAHQDVDQVTASARVDGWHPIDAAGSAVPQQPTLVTSPATASQQPPGTSQHPSHPRAQRKGRKGSQAAGGAARSEPQGVSGLQIHAVGVQQVRRRAGAHPPALQAQLRISPAAPKRRRKATKSSDLDQVASPSPRAEVEPQPTAASHVQINAGSSAAQGVDALGSIQQAAGSSKGGGKRKPDGGAAGQLGAPGAKRAKGARLTTARAQDAAQPGCSSQSEDPAAAGTSSAVPLQPVRKPRAAAVVNAGRQQAPKRGAPASQPHPVSQRPLGQRPSQQTATPATAQRRRARPVQVAEGQHVTSAARRRSPRGSPPCVIAEPAPAPAPAPGSIIRKTPHAGPASASKVRVSKQLSASPDLITAPAQNEGHSIPVGGSAEGDGGGGGLVGSQLLRQSADDSSGQRAGQRSSQRAKGQRSSQKARGSEQCTPEAEGLQLQGASSQPSSLQSSPQAPSSNARQGQGGALASKHVPVSAAPNPALKKRGGKGVKGRGSKRRVH